MPLTCEICNLNVSMLFERQRRRAMKSLHVYFDRICNDYLKIYPPREAFNRWVLERHSAFVMSKTKSVDNNKSSSFANNIQPDDGALDSPCRMAMFSQNVFLHSPNSQQNELNKGDCSGNTIVFGSEEIYDGIIPYFTASRADKSPKLPQWSNTLRLFKNPTIAFVRELFDIDFDNDDQNVGKSASMESPNRSTFCHSPTASDESERMGYMARSNTSVSHEYHFYQMYAPVSSPGLFLEIIDDLPKTPPYPYRRPDGRAFFLQRLGEYASSLCGDLQKFMRIVESKEYSDNRPIPVVNTMSYTQSRKVKNSFEHQLRHAEPPPSFGSVKQNGLQQCDKDSFSRGCQSNEKPLFHRSDSSQLKFEPILEKRFLNEPLKKALSNMTRYVIDESDMIHKYVMPNYGFLRKRCQDLTSVSQTIKNFCENELRSIRRYHSYDYQNCDDYDNLQSQLLSFELDHILRVNKDGSIFHDFTHAPYFDNSCWKSIMFRVKVLKRPVSILLRYKEVIYFCQLLEKKSNLAVIKLQKYNEFLEHNCRCAYVAGTDSPSQIALLPRYHVLVSNPHVVTADQSNDLFKVSAHRLDWSKTDDSLQTHVIRGEVLLRLWRRFNKCVQPGSKLNKCHNCRNQFSNILGRWKKMANVDHGLDSVNAVPKYFKSKDWNALKFLISYSNRLSHEEETDPKSSNSVSSTSPASTEDKDFWPVLCEEEFLESSGKSAMKQWELFKWQLWIILERYEVFCGLCHTMKEGKGHQSSVPIFVFNALIRIFDVKGEMFANSMNANLPYFSAFDEIERLIGSRGNFFDLTIDIDDLKRRFGVSNLLKSSMKSGQMTENRFSNVEAHNDESVESLALEVNPPFQEHVIARTLSRLLAWLNEADQRHFALCFILILPNWQHCNESLDNPNSLTSFPSPNTSSPNSPGSPMSPPLSPGSAVSCDSPYTSSLLRDVNARKFVKGDVIVTPGMHNYTHGFQYFKTCKCNDKKCHAGCVDECLCSKVCEIHDDYPIPCGTKIIILQSAAFAEHLPITQDLLNDLKNTWMQPYIERAASGDLPY